MIRHARLALSISRNRGIPVLGACALVVGANPAKADTFLDLTGGLTGWTTQGSVTLFNTTDAFNIGGNAFSLTPAAGETMAKIRPSGGNTDVNGTLGLSANAVESFLNNAHGSVTNFGLMTRDYTFDAGTYTFAWAYAAQDYVPFNDGVMFSLVGGGAETLISLARNGSNGADNTGPSPNTEILGSYGSTPWRTLTFSIAQSGTYQLGFAAYNWDDTGLNPNLYVAATEGSFTGTPPPSSGGSGGSTVFDTINGDVSASVYSTGGAAYSQPSLSFSGGTLQYASDTVETKGVSLDANGGAIDTQANTIGLSSIISGDGAFSKTGSGTLQLSGVNTYTGATIVSQGTLKLAGGGGIASSSGVTLSSGIFDIASTNTGASIKALSGTGSVALGSKNLTLTSASGSFSGGIAGEGSLIISSGTQTLAGTNLFTGKTLVSSGGTLALSGAGSIASSDELEIQGALDIAASSNDAAIKSLSGNGSVNLGTKQLSLTDAHTVFGGTLTGGGAVEVSGGTQKLTGSNTYLGATLVGAGATLALAGGGDIASSSGVQLQSGTFDIAGADGTTSIKALQGSGHVTLGANTLALTSTAGSFDGQLSGTGALAILGGFQVLGGSNTHTGGTLVANGSTLEISSNAALGDNSGALTLEAGKLKTTASFDLARNVVLSGDTILEAAAGTELTTSGAFSGSGHLYKSGSGKLVLAGDNRYWGDPSDSSLGGMTIDGGLVLVANPYGLGYGALTLNGGTINATVDILTGQTIAVAGDTVLNTDAGTTTTLEGQVMTGGIGSCFLKTGAGTLALTGNAQLSNGTCVNEGQLSVNGKLESTSVVVAEGALLRGAGLIEAPVNVVGTLAPGNSPGTLTVHGTVTMSPGSALQIDINGTGTDAGPNNYSRLIVAGADNPFVATSATLRPNLLNITGTDAYVPYVPQLGDTFRVVSSEGGVVGRFASLEQPQGMATNTRMQAFYDVRGNRSIDLRVIPTSYAQFVSEANLNTRTAGAALDAILGSVDGGTSSSAQVALSYDVAGLAAQQLTEASTRLAGEVHGAVAATAPLAGQWLDGAVGRQLRSRSASGEAMWLDVAANHGDWGSDSAASRFALNRTQVAFGLDLPLSETLSAGVGFSHADTDIAASGGTGNVRQNMAFVYGQAGYRGVSFDALAGYGRSTWDTKRAEPLGLPGKLAARQDGYDTLLAVGARLPWQAGSLALEPYARATWERISRDGFDEAGSVAGAATSLSGDDYSANGLRTMLGITGGSGDQNPRASRLTYRFNVGIAHDSGDLVRPEVHATLADAGTTIFAPHVGRTSLQANLTGTLQLHKRAFVFLGVSGEAREGTSEDVGINAGVRASF